jgi:hypothetical protein
MECDNGGVGSRVMIVAVIMIMVKRGRGNGGDD